MIFASFLLSLCLLADPGDGSLVCLDSGRLAMLGPSVELDGRSDHLFEWEGMSSKASFSNGRIDFKLDIVGPDWLSVAITNSPSGGIDIHCRRTSAGCDKSICEDGRHFARWADLLADDDYGVPIAALLSRCGQNPRLREIGRPEMSHEDRVRVFSLVDQLDRDFRARRDAIRQLKEIPGAAELALSQGMELSVNQRAVMESMK